MLEQQNLLLVNDLACMQSAVSISPIPCVAVLICSQFPALHAWIAQHAAKHHMADITPYGSEDAGIILFTIFKLIFI